MNWIKLGLLVLFLLVEVVSLSAQEKFRTERDLLGGKQFPGATCYRVRTAHEQEIFSEEHLQQSLDPVKLTGLDKSKYQNP